jgi:DNA-binding transcriptional MerR regulator
LDYLWDTGRATPQLSALLRVGAALDSGVDSRLYSEKGVQEMTGARIGRVAQETGLSIDTIRFYEKQGLLRRSPRTEGGFRLFAVQDVETLKFVRNAQQLGFSLNEIRELLVLQADHIPACSHVKELLDQKLATVQQKIVELQILERSLTGALQKCRRELKTGSPGHGECCPVIEEMKQAAQRDSHHEN